MVEVVCDDLGVGGSKRLLSLNLTTVLAVLLLGLWLLMSCDNIVYFKYYNLPHKPVRVFTFLVGRNSTPMDKETMEWIACENKGEFVVDNFLLKSSTLKRKLKIYLLRAI